MTGHIQPVEAADYSWLTWVTGVPSALMKLFLYDLSTPGPGPVALTPLTFAWMDVLPIRTTALPTPLTAAPFALTPVPLLPAITLDEINI